MLREPLRKLMSNRDNNKENVYVKKTNKKVNFE